MSSTETGATKSMDNRNYEKAKKLVLIPIIVLLSIAICMGVASILEVPTNRGTIYSLLVLIGILGMFLAPLPCLVMSVIGTVFAIKATKEGTKQACKFIVTGLIEILAHIIFVILAIAMFIGGQSV